MAYKEFRLTRRRLLAWGGLGITGLVAGACGEQPSQGAGGAPGTTSGTGGTPGSAGTGGSDAGVSDASPDAALSDAGQEDAEADAAEDSGTSTNPVSRDPKAVAIVRCSTYDTATVRAALVQALGLLGDVKALVSGKTVAIKPNLTGAPFETLFGKPAGETYVTHGATVMALASILFEAGAKRVRIVESIATTSAMSSVLTEAGWDVAGLLALGSVDLENTRNLGSGLTYSRLSVPSGGLLYTYFDVNAAYHDVDVLVSLCKLKQHAIAGVTLSMKNLFGMTPLSLYGTQVDLGEQALGYRVSMHDGVTDYALPGEKTGYQDQSPEWRVPRIIVDQVAARPVELAIVDGISAMSGGEGPWQTELAATTPGVIVAGWNPVSTDAVATAIMGLDPLAAAGSGAFPGDNHLLLAQQQGLGGADPAQLDVRGESIASVLYPYT